MNNLCVGDVIVCRNLTFRLVIAEEIKVYSSCKHVRTLHLLTLDEGESHYIENGSVVKWGYDPLDDRSDMIGWTFVIKADRSRSKNDRRGLCDEMT